VVRKPEEETAWRQMGDDNIAMHFRKICSVTMWTGLFKFSVTTDGGLLCTR
jgi:hypothetical protein